MRVLKGGIGPKLKVSKYRPVDSIKRAACIPQDPIVGCIDKSFGVICILQ